MENIEPFLIQKKVLDNKISEYKNALIFKHVQDLSELDIIRKSAKSENEKIEYVSKLYNIIRKYNQEINKLND